MAKKPSLVFIPIPAVGHIVSAIELAKLLIDRHDRLSVTVLVIKIPNSPNFSALIESLSASVTGRICFIDLPQLELPSPDMAQSAEGIISIFMDKHKPFVKDAITQLFLTGDTDSEPTRPQLAGLVVDLFGTSMIDVANDLGVPSYVFFSSTAGFLSIMLHLPILDTQIHTDFKDSETFTIPGFVNPVPPHVLPSAVWSKNQDGYTWFLYHSRRFSETKGIILNSFAELEPHAVSFLTSHGRTPPVYPIGPLLDLQGQMHSRLDQTSFESIKIWLDNQPPSSVVLLCFGSFGSFGVPQVKEIARGLERSGHRFLWALRQPSKGLSNPTDYANLNEVLPEGFLDRTAERGLVCGWVSQVAVLAHRAIGGFVSHCGWNSILESVWFGVPIAAWPMYAEQHLNAFELIRELGGLTVELRLDYRGGDDLVTAEEVERAVRCLMDSNCEVRMRVKEMKEKSRRVVMDGGSSFTTLTCLIKDLQLGES